MVMRISCNVKYYTEFTNWIFAPAKIGFPPKI